MRSSTYYGPFILFVKDLIPIAAAVLAPLSPVLYSTLRNGHHINYFTKIVRKRESIRFAKTANTVSKKKMITGENIWTKKRRKKINRKEKSSNFSKIEVCSRVTRYIIENEERMLRNAI